jgi:hypothetical protein
MENTNLYEPPKGGRLSSPKFRGLAQISENFDGLPDGTTRFDLLHLIKDVGPATGFTPRMIELLEYYILFTRDCDWQPGGRPMVYQSQAKTAKHFRVSERQIQRLEKALFDSGALTWDTAANNKRYGARTDSGALLYASGVDLSPLAALQEALEQKKEEIKLENEAWFETKRQISNCRGRIKALIAEAAAQPALISAAGAAQYAYNCINGHIRTYMDLPYLRDLLRAHNEVYQTLLAAIESYTPAQAETAVMSSLSQNVPSTDDKNVAHIYSTNHPQFSKENTSSPKDINASNGSVADSVVTYREEWMAALTVEKSRISWKQVLAACSERFKDRFPMISGRPLGWSDIVQAAYDLLPTLGISKSAWIEACMVLGRDGAALAVMIIDRKVQDPENAIKNPGGYLRAMTDRAKVGKLNLHRSIFGLLKREADKYDA